MAHSSSFALVICLTALATKATAHRVITYQTVDSGLISSCHRLLNSTGSIGCHGPLKPIAGILLTNLTDDVIAYITTHTSYYPFIAVLNASQPNLTQTLLKLNRANANVVGVLVVSDGIAKLGNDHRRSDDVACPGTLAHGNDPHCFRWIDSPDDSIGAFFRHWKFPIFYLDEHNLTTAITNCTTKWNSGLFTGNGSSVEFRDRHNFRLGVYCAAELYQPNYAPAVSGDRCLKQTDRTVTLDKISYCDKIRARNVLVPLMPMSYRDYYANQSIFLLVARLDSLSLFPGKSPGADSVFTGLIALFAIADALARNRAHFKGTARQVIFAFYGGESLDNIGSSYHAFKLDRRRGQRKSDSAQTKRHGALEQSGIDEITLDQVGYLLELNQLAIHGQHAQFWIHSSSLQSGANDSLSDRLFASAETVPNVLLKRANASYPLPPSSATSFSLFGGSHIEAAVITNHEAAFTNRYYHSLFDRNFNVLPFEASNASSNLSPLVLHLSAIATVVSRTVAKFLRKDIDAQALQADANLVRQLVHCIFVNQSCPLLQHIQKTQFYNESTLDSTDTLAPNMTTVNLVYDLMSNLTGERVACPSKNNLSNADAFHYRLERPVNGSNSSKMCYRSQVFRQLATSPYFLDAPGHLKSGLSQWVLGHQRPAWASPKLRLFLLPTRCSELLVLALGIAFTLLTVFVLAICCH